MRLRGSHLICNRRSPLRVTRRHGLGRTARATDRTQHRHVRGGLNPAGSDCRWRDAGSETTVVGGQQVVQAGHRVVDVGG